MKEEIKVYESWEQLTVGQYDELIRIQQAHPKDCAKYVVEYLYDIDNADNLPLPEYSCYVAGLRRFIDNPIPKAKFTPSVSYKLNGRNYRVDITPTAFTVAQYTDLTNYLKRQKATLVDLLSVVVIPADNEYNDGYDMQQARADIAALPLTAGMAVVGFFARWSKSSIRVFLRSLTKQMKGNKTIAPETLARIEKEVEQLWQLMASLPMC